jgi:hypothetical protein
MVGREEDGGWHDLGGPAHVAWPETQEGEVQFLGTFMVRLVVPTGPALTWNAAAGPGRTPPSHRPAAVGDVALEIGAVIVLRGLRAHHGSDHLLL